MTSLLYCVQSGRCVNEYWGGHGGVYDLTRFLCQLIFILVHCNTCTSSLSCCYQLSLNLYEIHHIHFGLGSASTVSQLKKGDQFKGRGRTRLVAHRIRS